MEDIKVIFIIPKNYQTENECSEEMKLAFIACEQHSGSGLQAQWVHENQWKKFEGLTKRDVFVLTQFDGEMYKKLHATKCLLVGPRCLSCCLTEGAPIPSGPEPVFTVAMRGLVVTASGLTKQQKENIKTKVHWMGGLYKTVLTNDTTHLVSDTVLSDKYIKAVEKGIPVMTENWIEAVWEASLQLNVSGSSSDFDVHRLPIFANLQITTSGITKRDKQLIMKLVNENGGVFSGAFQSETTDVVILTKEGVGSEKYKAALEYGKACVLPAWVKESAARGAALPLARFRVAGASTSSPFAEHRLPDMSLNFSRITAVKPPSNFVDETRATDISTMSGKMKLSQESKRISDSSIIDKEIQTEFENFDMSLVKKAGPIFDGFCIWVAGPEGTWRERAGALVARAGGVRYERAHDRVTHCVCTRASAPAAARALPAAPVLSPLWLLRSVQAGRALDEAEFLWDTRPGTPAKGSARRAAPEPASPMSRRNLQLLRRGPLALPPPTPDPASPPDPHEPQDELLNHYLSQNVPEQTKEKSPEPVPEPSNMTRQDEPDVTEDVDEPTEEIEQIFKGIKLEVQGLDEEAICELGAEVAAAGGAVAAAGAGGSHVLVPLDFDPADLLTPHAEAVTVFWVKDCLCQQELVSIQYYHRPVRLRRGARSALRGVVASLSSYSGVERAFLDELAKLLGATTQLRFCRRNTASAVASTHLVCPAPLGDKYSGAVKWGLPAVTGAWLLHCAREGRRLHEGDYLVGDTKAPSSPEKKTVDGNPDEVSLQTKEHAENMKDKENEMLPPAGTVVPRSSLPTAEHTPKVKPGNEGESEMSPASRYIAMARQGLLGCDSQETPKRLRELRDDPTLGGEGVVKTPPLDDALSTPNLQALSPTTRRRLQALRRGEMPSDPVRTPADPFSRSPATPDSAFGAALRAGAALSPPARKRLWTLVRGLPDKPPDSTRDKHTPLSEIRNRFLAQFNSDAPTPPSEHNVAPRKLQLQEQADTPPAKMAKILDGQSPSGASNIEADEPENTKSASSAPSNLPMVDVQLQLLNAALSNRLSSQRAKRTRESVSVPLDNPGPESEVGPQSQPNTVGWDDTTRPQLEPAPVIEIKRFMLSSNVDNREEIIEMIEYLGGEVCEGTELDPAATHLLCAAPGRSEKMLGSIAAGRWVLHPAYVPRSRAAGTFLPEEEYEWGNPLATSLPAAAGAERGLARAAHRWRVARAVARPGPFAGVVALLHVPPPRRRLLARLVVAGGGLAPDDEPPYTNESITVCFADVKRYPLSARDVTWLTSRRIPVCAPVLLSAFLTDEQPPVASHHCLPEYAPA